MKAPTKASVWPSSSWWKSVKNIYGLIMGTSTDWMKPSQRPHWPTGLVSLDDNFQVFLGGTGNCGVLKNGDKTLYINCNSGPSAEVLFSQARGESPQGVTDVLIGTSCFIDYVGGLSHGRWGEIYLPVSSQSEFVKGIASAVETSSPHAKVHWLKSAESFVWGDEEISLLPVEWGFSKHDIVVYLHRRKVLFLGGLFYNGVHPVLDKERGVRPQAWLAALRDLPGVLPGEVLTYVPHEGDLCDHRPLDAFVDYLATLSNADVEFSECRQKFDWIEIPGYTSLEENFNFLRK